MTETRFYFEIHSTFKYPFESHQLARQMHTNQARQEEEEEEEEKTNIEYCMTFGRDI